MDLWAVALTANAVVAVAYLAISFAVLRGVHRSGQWRTNPLAVATGAIFLTCAAGHGSHVEHMLLPGSAEAARSVYDWHLTAIDMVTAVVGVRYWMLRNRFGTLVRGASLFEDLAVRRAEAFDIQDGVVQHLATAKMALDLGDQEMGRASLDRALTASRQLITKMAAEDADESFQPAPGQLRRRSATS